MKLTVAMYIVVTLTTKSVSGFVLVQMIHKTFRGKKVLVMCTCNITPVCHKVTLGTNLLYIYISDVHSTMVLH